MDPEILSIGLLLAAVLAAGCAGNLFLPGKNSTPAPPDDAVILPAPRSEGGVSVEEALWKRRSARIYAEVPLMLADVGQVLWAAQGITNDRGYRTTPSAGALYPLEVYVVAGSVVDLEARSTATGPMDTCSSASAAGTGGPTSRRRPSTRPP